MYGVVIALVLLALGCNESAGPTPRSSVEPTKAPEPLAPSAAGAAISATAAKAAPVPSDYYTAEDLARLGLRTSVVGDGETLICGSEPNAQCLCLMPLVCDPGGCMGFNENLAAFRSALKDPAPGRKVQCDEAEVGACDAFRYFEFQGDLYRRELRWFDANGGLVGQRDVTDYAAYCGGQTRARFIGRIPKCSAMSSLELICGERSKTLDPLEDLRRFARPPAKPTALPRQ